jgi:hypothetical protein
MKKMILFSLLFAAVLFAVSSTVEATVLRVVVVQTEDPDAYTKSIQQGQELLTKAGSSGKIRVWRARFAGDEAGTVVVSVEYPDLAAIAADDKRMAENAEISAWLKSLDKLRKIVSDSIYTELK